MTKAPSSLTRLFAGLAVAMLALAMPASADRVVNANEPVVLSDDIRNESVTVVSASQGGSGNNNNRSGLGDGTNPGQGSGKSNSSNTGTNNPGGAKKGK